ncbi:MAG: protein translocase subunit SecD [Arachnia propionica]|nr:MAG: protein translocase subunit SecD [Arachnia propionica]
MATTARRSRPGVVISVLLAIMAAMYAVMGLTQVWTPKLGLDLQGGMTITLTATNSTVTPESLELARDIMQQRVDGLGVGEAAVATSGDRTIIVSAPNIQRDDLVQLVGATAQLTFRQVLNLAPIGQTTQPEEKLPGLPEAPQEADSDGKLLSVKEALAYEPTPADITAFNEFKCGDAVVDRLDQAMVACDEANKYLLGPVAITGDRVTKAASGVPDQQAAFVVTLTFDDEGTDRLLELSTDIVNKPNPRNMFAIVLDGQIREAASVREPIPGGSAMISGNFTPESAAALANVLRFGSLPLTFEPSQVESISPTLGGEQLRIGLIAGLVGLIIVVIYAFLYYRGLGVAVVGSLLVAAGTTYAAMVLLGQAVGFAVNLPAIAGAIVAIGLTADSFVIYFERIRDEIREGRSLHSALQTGWVKARSTIVVADVVSMLSATVLFILAEGGVKGFAFTLGLTTLIDLAVVFMFTHPLVLLLSRTKFYGEAHALSGLDASHMGVSRESLLGRRSRKSARNPKEAR